MVPAAHFCLLPFGTYTALVLSSHSPAPADPANGGCEVWGGLSGHLKSAQGPCMGLVLPRRTAMSLRSCLHAEPSY